MKKSIFFALCAACGVSATVGVLLNSCSDQPKPMCIIGRGDGSQTAAGIPGGFAVVFTSAIPGPNNGANCAPSPGEVMGTGMYYHPRSADDLMPDFNAGALAIEPGPIVAELHAREAEGVTGELMTTVGQPYTMARFATPVPDSDNFCNVVFDDPRLTATGSFPELPERLPIEDGGAPLPARPALNVSYTWQWLRVYVSPGQQGNMIVGDVDTTVNDCQYRYHAIGVWPATPCTSLDDCLPADPDNGRLSGSSLTPELSIQCHPTLRVCTLNAEPPSFK